MMTIRHARGAADLDAVRRLMRAYAAEADVAFCFKTLEAELAALPGSFVAVLIGLLDDRPVGCIALKALSDGRIELVRLYVAKEARRRGLGRALIEAALRAARDAGHHVVVMHTLARWREATALYRAMGFVPTAPYCEVSLDDVLFFERPTASARVDPR